MNYLIVIIFHIFFDDSFIFMSTFLFDNSDIYYSENIHFIFIFILNLIIWETELYFLNIWMMKLTLYPSDHTITGREMFKNNK